MLMFDALYRRNLPIKNVPIKSIMLLVAFCVNKVANLHKNQLTRLVYKVFVVWEAYSCFRKFFIRKNI
jgi:hypothetical protein